MQSIFDNLTNGNLTDALRSAKRYRYARLFRFALHDLGWSPELARAAADYLKGQGTFQAYCDAK